jgi:hypothetical protein
MELRIVKFANGMDVIADLSKYADDAQDVCTVALLAQVLADDLALCVCQSAASCSQRYDNQQPQQPSPVASGRRGAVQHSRGTQRINGIEVA